MRIDDPCASFETLAFAAGVRDGAGAVPAGAALREARMWGGFSDLAAGLYVRGWSEWRRAIGDDDVS